MKIVNLSKKKKTSNMLIAGGPSPEEQLSSMAKDKYWTVLETWYLKLANNEDKFNTRVNAFKHALQIYGPCSKENLPNLIWNTGKAMGEVFHGHILNSNGTTYVLEWAVIDKKSRIMALLDFAPHENYKYRQTPLTQTECLNILSKPANINILNNTQLKIIEAKNKFNHSPANNLMR